MSLIKLNCQFFFSVLLQYVCLQLCSLGRLQQLAPGLRIRMFRWIRILYRIRIRNGYQEGQNQNRFFLQYFLTKFFMHILHPDFNHFYIEKKS